MNTIEQEEKSMLLGQTPRVKDFASITSVVLLMERTLTPSRWNSHGQGPYLLSDCEAKELGRCAADMLDLNSSCKAVAPSASLASCNFLISVSCSATNTRLYLQRCFLFSKFLLQCMCSYKVCGIHRFLQLSRMLSPQSRKHLAWVTRVILCAALQGR